MSGVRTRIFGSAIAHAAADAPPHRRRRRSSGEKSAVRPWPRHESLHQWNLRINKGNGPHEVQPDGIRRLPGPEPQLEGLHMSAEKLGVIAGVLLTLSMAGSATAQNVMADRPLIVAQAAPPAGTADGAAAAAEAEKKKRAAEQQRKGPPPGKAQAPPPQRQQQPPPQAKGPPPRIAPPPPAAKAVTPPSPPPPAARIQTPPARSQPPFQRSRDGRTVSPAQQQLQTDVPAQAKRPPPRAVPGLVKPPQAGGAGAFTSPKRAGTPPAAEGQKGPNQVLRGPAIARQSG